MLTKAASRKRAQRAIPIMTSCSRCGATDTKLERHHKDYQKPTDVMILCCQCHAAVEQESGQRPVRPAKTCTVCGKAFTTYTHSRVKTCGAACLRSAGRTNALKRWGRRITTSPPTGGPSAPTKRSPKTSPRASRAKSR